MIPVFNILAVKQSENILTASLATNPNSAIFEGHFPGQPVVPGACMLQLVKDVLSDQLKLTLKLLKADNIKFLGLIKPVKETLTLQISYQLIENQVKITATLSTAGITCMKLQGTFVSI